MALKSFSLCAALALSLSLYVPQLAYGQWIRGTGEALFMDVCSDYMYRFRVPVTPKSNIVYATLSSGDLVAYQYDRSERGILDPTWQAEPIPGLDVVQPVLNVDTTTDRVYLIHPANGRIYCYDASLNRTSPVWVSDFVCTLPDDPRNQTRQAFSCDGSRLLARCNDSVVLADAGSGARIKTFGGPGIAAFVNYGDLAAPIAVYANFTKFITWAAVPSGDSDASPPNKLAVWDMAVRTRNPTKPSAVIPLPDGAAAAGVNAGSSPWLLAVPDAAQPVLHLVSSANGKVQSSFDFGPILNADGSLSDLLVLPTPAIANRTVYGIVQGVLLSPYPWIPGYPDKYYWWAFALDVSKPKEPVLLWNTSRLDTRGPLVKQVPLVRGPAVFVTDYQQNATRSFRRADGGTFYNVPANPYSSSTTTTYSIIKGTYKMSLPYASPDGMYLWIQYDDWMYDMAAPEKRASMSAGAIRTMIGLPSAASSSAVTTGGVGRRRR